MNISDFASLLASLGSGLLGGMVVALVNHLLTRKRMTIEVVKLKAEADKLTLEAEKLRFELKDLAETVTYNAPETELVIYDAQSNFDKFDFEGQEGKFYDVKTKQRYGDKGKGVLEIDDDGILNLKRTNTGGRYEIWLRSYRYQGKERDYMPPNETIAGRRKLRVNCDIKAAKARHRVRFVIKNKDTGDWLDSKTVPVDSNEWSTVDLYFRVSRSKKCLLRIDDEEISENGASLQLRNLVLAEKSQ